MEQKRNSPYASNRSIETVRSEELLLAASWWAANAVTMTPADPWKSHAAIIPLIALLAPSPAALKIWLTHADSAVGKTPGNIYACALIELMHDNPPWARANNFCDVHTEKWSVDMRLIEMKRLLDEVRDDMQIRGVSTITGGVQ